MYGDTGPPYGRSQPAISAQIHPRRHANPQVSETSTLIDLQDDKSRVSWPVDASKPNSSTGHEEKRRGTGWGAFLGALVGMLFFVPVLGAAAGAAIGRAVKSGEGTSLNKDDLERIRAEVTPGTSALFAVTDQGSLDRLAERFHGMNQKLITTNLTESERQELIDSFGGA
jgi:uncharacterized membrane protein